jgi:SNF2 family DNA or RNA helicase
MSGVLERSIMSFPENEIEILPSWEEYSKNPDNFPLPEGGRLPFNYQVKVINWGIEKLLNGQNALPEFIEMRLGKTLITSKLCLWLQKWRNCQRFLIVCPKTVIPVWEKELAYEGITGLRFDSKITRTPLFAAIQKLPGFFVTNYETLTRTEVSKFPWDVVILDETTKVRYPDTKITKTVIHDFVEIPYKFALTGSPDPEGLLDYFCQMKFCFGHCMGVESYWKFKDRFFMAQGANKFRPLRGFKEQFSQYLAENAYVLTREQVDMGSHKVYQQRYVDMSEDALAFYKDFESMWVNEEFDTQWAIVAFNYMQQMAGGYPKKKEFSSNHKIEEIWDLMETDLKHEKVVIWCRFRNEIDEVVNKLKFKYLVDKIDGSVPNDLRAAIIKDFQETNTIQILVAQIRTASMGVDFSASDTVIYYSNGLGALDRIQSEDRVIHPNKKSPVLFIDILTNDTIDIDVYNRYMDKKNNRENFLQDIFRNMRARQQ